MTYQSEDAGRSDRARDPFADVDFSGNERPTEDRFASRREADPSAEFDGARGREPDPDRDLWGQESAFEQRPIEVINSDDERDERAFDGFSSGDSSDGADEQTLGEAAEADAHDSKPAASPKKNKPNVGILVGAGVAGLMVLGGAGWMGMNMLGLWPSTQATAPAIAPMQEESSMVFSGLETPSSTGVLSEPAAPASPSALDATSTMAEVDALVAQTAATATATAATATAATATAAAAAATAATAAAAAATAATAARPQPTPVARPAQAATPTPAPVRTATAAAPARPAARAAPRPPRTASRAVARVTPPAPRESVRDNTVHVVAVYPQSGRMAKAWIRNQDGHLTVVREGDIYHGVQIRSVQAERMEVETSDGRLWGPNRVAVGARS